MKALTIVFGILLFLLGAVYYTTSGMAGIAAMVPALVGLLVILFGLQQGRWEHNHPLYGCLMLTFLIFISSLGYLVDLFRVLTIGEVAVPNVTAVRSVIGVLSLVYVVLGVTLISDFWNGWKAFGQFMGNWVARIVLTGFYFSVLIPFGLGVRLLADPLLTKRQPHMLWQPRATDDQTLEDTQRQY
jgi:hypothetical protein